MFRSLQSSCSGSGWSISRTTCRSLFIVFSRLGCRCRLSILHEIFRMLFFGFWRLRCASCYGIFCETNRTLFFNYESSRSASWYSVSVPTNRTNLLRVHSISTVLIVLHFWSLYQLLNVIFKARWVSKEKLKICRSFAVLEIGYHCCFKTQLYSIW